MAVHPLADVESDTERDAALLADLRVLLVDTDPARANAIARELRARKVVVAVADAGGRDLESARALDPEVVILDAVGIEGPGFEVVSAIRRDVRLRWASMLVAPWDDIWPTSESTPNVGRLAERIAPLVEKDRALRARVATETAFDARLESTGPCRFLRILAASPNAVHAAFRSRAASVEVDVAPGLIVGAQGAHAGGDTLEGVRALSVLLAMSAARVHVERRANPTVANLMTPVEEALSRAAREVAPDPISAPLSGGDAQASSSARRPPFRAGEPSAQGGAPKLDDGPAGAARGAPAPLDAARAPTRGRWSETDERGDAAPPARASLAMTAFSTAVPGVVPRPLITPRPSTAAFGVAAESGRRAPRDASEGPSNGPVDRAAPIPESRQAAPRRPMLAMGSPVAVAPGPLALPTAAAGALSRNATATTGSARAAAPGSPPAASGDRDGAVATPSTATPGKHIRVAPKRTLLGVAAEPARPGPAPQRVEPLPSALDAEQPDVTTVSSPAVESDAEATMPGGGPSFADLVGAPEAGGEGIASLLDPGGDTARDLDMLGELPPGTGSPDPLDSLPDVRPIPRPGAIGFAQPPAATSLPSTSEASARARAPALSGQMVPVPARPRTGARTLGWLVVGGVLAVGVFGGVLAWARLGDGSIDALLAMVGIGSGETTIVASAPDADEPPALPVASDDDARPAADAPHAALAALVVGALDAGADDRTDAGSDMGTRVAAVGDDGVAEAPAAVDGETAEALVERVEGMSPAARATAGEALYRRALELDPRYHHAMTGLAELLMETGRPAEAIPLIENAIARRPSRASYRVLLGDARRAVGDADGAAAAWREALEIEPENRRALDRLE